MTARAGPGLIALAAISWGTTGATMKLVALDSPMSPLLVGFFRVALAAPCLLLAARAQAGAFRLPGGRDLPRLLLAGVAMGGYQACYFWAVAKTSVTVAALLAIASAPIMIALLAVGLLGERMTTVTWVALGAGVSGTGLLVLGPRGGVGELPPEFLGGAILALGAGLAYALYAVFVKSVVGKVPPLTVVAVTFSVAALTLAPAVLLEPVAGGPAAWGLLAYLGLVPTAGAYILYVLGLRTTQVTVSGILTLLEPLTATTLGMLLFGDRLGMAGGVGAGLLLGAIALLMGQSPVHSGGEGDPRGGP